jgi:MFS superfamily sulfate permease-like transporter
MLGLVALTMAIIHFLPKLTTAVPASLVANVSVTLLVFYLDLDTRTVQAVLADMTGNPQATIAGGLPSFHIPMVPLNFETLSIVLPYALILAAVGLIESLLTLSLIDELTGPLFFGSVQTFADLFDPKIDPDEVMVDFASARVFDHSGLEAIDALAERYMRVEKRLHIKHLNQECQNLLVKAGDLVEVNMLEDPRYHVADDRLA